MIILMPGTCLVGATTTRTVTIGETCTDHTYISIHINDHTPEPVAATICSYDKIPPKKICSRYEAAIKRVRHPHNRYNKK